ncbi:unnamed protein product [Plutella xylostella]|uniref:(diamondback moth) hypothetical protein n=1 Tax=Plutella xylostella TaxID=51655 RepID=A0A8S4FUZ1_PLUXY|nr:unnamed protein product [Plutella xylostella]
MAAQSKKVTYPDAWFEANRGKPVVSTGSSTESIDDLRKAILHGFENSNIDKEVAKVYMTKLAATIKAKCPVAWMSYGVEICAEGAEITPLDLIKHNQQDAVTVGTKVGAEKDESNRNVLLLLLTIYRVLRISNAEGKQAVIDHFKKQLDTIGDRRSIVSAHATKIATHATWQSDREYIKIVAMYDMFLYRFSDVDMASARFGSISSRYRDCAALLSVGFVSKLVGLATEGLADWVFVNSIADELEQMTEDNNYQESLNEFSYFAYQADFGLVSKSAYSSVANPGTFFWLHVIGALMGSKRSLMARKNTDVNTTNLMTNAIIVAFAHKRNITLCKPYTEDGDELEEGEGGSGLAGAFHSTNATEWFEHMRVRNFELTDSMKEFFAAVKVSLPKPREGTIGEYLKAYVVCDADLKIRDIVTRWHGRVHDSRIYRECRLMQRFEAGAFRGVLLGDGGYPCTSHWFTPVLHHATQSEEQYNRCHIIKTRNAVKRCFGLWKQLMLSNSLLQLIRICLGTVRRPGLMAHGFHEGI